MRSPLSPIGTVVLSIDLPPEAGHHGTASIALANKLFRMVDARRLPASWVPHNHDQFSLRERLSLPTTRHDLALVGDPSWIGKEAGRTRFARELAQRVAAVRADNINVQAIALRDTQLDEHLDLLVKHRIGVIRGKRQNGGKLQPQSLRFGVWSSPVSVVLPQSKDWSWFGAGWSARQTISRAAKSGSVVHIMADGARLAASSSTLSEFDLVLAHLQRQRDKGALAVQSLSGLAECLAPKPSSRRATSILRAA